MTDKPVSPLRQRMIEDMTVRHFKEKVQKDYIRRVTNFKDFLGRSPDTATSEDFRLFQLHMTRNHVGAPSINCAIVALRFFFKVTLERPDLVRHLTFVHEPRKLPIVLSPEEVARLLEAAPGVKYKAALSVAYGAGLRVSEVVSLKVSGRLAEGVGYRQQAYDAPCGARQGRQGSPRDALAAFAGAFARLVADRAATSLAVSWAGPGQKQARSARTANPSSFHQSSATRTDTWTSAARSCGIASWACSRSLPSDEQGA